MKLASSAVKLASLAVLLLALTTNSFQASASPAKDPGDSPSGFSISALRSHDLTDVNGFNAQSVESKTLNAQGFSVMQTASRQTAVVDRSMADQGIITAAGRKFVDISWQGYSKQARYVVTRDDKKVATLAPGATTFHDAHVTPGSVYHYSIAPVLPEGSNPQASVWGMQVAVPSVAKNGNSLTALRKQAVSRAVVSKAARTTTLSWMTFIPQKRIDAPPAGCSYGKGYQFAGDNHSSFDWKSSKYRTALNALITWSKKSVQGSKDVQASHVYRKSTGKLIATKTATNKDMVVKKMGSGSNYVDVRMVTHATNPFCKGLGSVKGAIDGAFSMHLTTSGNYSIRSGKHRLMPNHYIYIYNGGKVTNVYKRKYANAACLIGSAACQEADLTAYYGKF
ncbi:hypothetical protein ACFYSJ_35180 [Streptomyces sp. NPDC005248]|uniref:hypothetical protein n=1 Tax=unclassified Streptomyces TaxID=2593676 RepID=UPI0033A0CD00